MSPRDAPMASSAPTSWRFSMASRISVLTMLSAATSTIRARMRNIVVFSIFMKRNRFAFCSIQSLLRNG